MKRTIFSIILHLIIVQLLAQENYHEESLNNGLRLLVIEDSSLPIVHIEMAFKSGGFVETPDIDGMSHFYEHMIFNATAGYATAKIFNDEVLKNGIITNAGTDQELVNYYFTLPSTHFLEGMDLFSQGILNPLFLEEEIENEKQIVNNEFERYEADPMFLLDRETDHKLWGDYFSRKNVIGDHNIILSAKTEQLQELQKKYYHPNNALLIIAGNVSKETALAAVKERFEDWRPSSEDPNRLYPVPEFPKMDQSVHFAIISEHTEEPIALYAWQGPDSQDDPDGLFAAIVLGQILNLKNSKFQQRLVETNLFYECDVRSTFSRYTSSIYIEAYPNENKVSKAVKAIDEEIKRWTTTDYFSTEELNAAISLIHVNEAYLQEELSEYIHELSYRWSSGDIIYPEEYLDRIDKVSLGDIQNLINNYIANQPISSGLIISPAQKKRVSKMGYTVEY